MQTQLSPAHGKPERNQRAHPNPKQMPITNVDLSSVDQVPMNAHSSHGESQFYIFEVNEAVIKMTIKGKSPTMRRVSRTHRVALDWLFDRINSDPKIQIKYVDTENQLAGMLTKGSFTRDECHNLLHLLNIIIFSTFSRSHFFRSNRKQSVMSKRSQGFLSDNSLTVKAKSKSMNLVSHRNLSIVRQNSQNTTDPKISVSDRTVCKLRAIGAK